DTFEPISFDLQQNYPNPFNPTTSINFSLPSEGDVSLVIYNILGKRIKTLVDEYKTAGRYNVSWNGRDDNGNSVSSGIYFYSLRSSGLSTVKKMIMLK
ncbi:MAG: T9SS type A sorting domain-containing protein, partial [Ignavibacteriaceae bacterium]